jgi:peptidoglycan hydrolase-like protein with peptidoglycan-binding domain
MPIADITVGMRGAGVTWVQEFLIRKNIGTAARSLASVGATGYFGELTRAALAEYQAAHAIAPSSGYYGPLTRAQIAATEQAGE